MANLADDTTITPTRVLIVGLPGSGKSTLAAQLAKSFHLIWLDLENSKDTLKKLPIEYQRNIDYIKIPDSARFPIAAPTLINLFNKYKGTICHKHGNFDCLTCKKNGDPVDFLDLLSLTANDIVVLDTASQLGLSILAFLTKDKDILYKPLLDDWGGLRKHTENFASQFQAAPFNLIVLCHATEAELEDGRKKLVPLFGSSGMSAGFASKFNHVIYCEVVNKQHRFFSSSTAMSNVITKSRTGFEIEKLPEPSLLPLLEYYREISEGKEPTSRAAGLDTQKLQESGKEVAPAQGEVATMSLKEKLEMMKKGK